MIPNNPENEMRPEDNYRLPWEVRQKNALDALRGVVEDFPPTLKQIIRQILNGEVSRKDLEEALEERAIYEAFWLTDPLFDVLRTASAFESSLGRMVRVARLFRELRSISEIANFISDTIALGPSENVLGMYISSDRDGYRNRFVSQSVYPYILNLLQSKEFNEQEQAELREWLILWESALIEIYCDPNRYYVKVEGGNQGTLSEFVGSALFWSNLTQSPTFRSGLYFDRIFESISYDDICSGKIRRDEGDGNDPEEGTYSDYIRQSFLLEILTVGQGESQPLPIGYWVDIMQNPDFCRRTFRLMTELRELASEEKKAVWDEVIEEAFLKTLDAHWFRFKDNNVVYEHNGIMMSYYLRAAAETIDHYSVNDLAVTKFEKTYPDLRYKTRFSELFRTSPLDYSQIFFTRPEIVVLHDVVTDPETGNSFVDYSVVGPTVNQRFTVEYNPGTDDFDVDLTWIETIAQQEQFTDDQRQAFFDQFRKTVVDKITAYLAFEAEFYRLLKEE